MLVSTEDLAALSPLHLLRLHDATMVELRRRGLIRNANTPVGDLAERLCRDAFGWTIAPPSMPTTNAVARDGAHLAAILFDANGHLVKAAIATRATIASRARYRARTNSSPFLMSDGVWRIESVVDITSPLQSAAAALSIAGTVCQ